MIEQLQGYLEENKDKVTQIDTRGMAPEKIVDMYYAPFNKELVYANWQTLADPARPMDPKEALRERYEYLKAAYNGQYVEKIAPMFNLSMQKIILTIESHNHFMDFAEITNRGAGELSEWYFEKNRRVGMNIVQSDGVQPTRQFINTDTVWQSPALIEICTDAVQLPTWSPRYSERVFVDQHDKAMKALRLSMSDKIDVNVQTVIDAGIGAFPANAVDYAPRVQTALIPTTNLITYSTGGKLTKELFKRIFGHFDLLTSDENPRYIRTMEVPLNAKQSLWDWVSVVNSSAVVGNFAVPYTPVPGDYATHTISPQLQAEIERTGTLLNLFGQPTVLKVNNTLPSGTMYVSTNLPACRVDMYPDSMIPKVWDQRSGNLRFTYGELRKVMNIYQPDPYRLNVAKVNFA
jgi:hypothetical protein